MKRAMRENLKLENYCKCKFSTCYFLSPEYSGFGGGF